MASEGTRPTTKEQHKKAARSKQHRAPNEEGDPILSGRMVVALAMALAMSIIPVSGLGRLITKKSPTSTRASDWKPGMTTTVHLTATTADYTKLACSDARKIEGGSHCEYRTDREEWPRAPGAPVEDNKRSILQPYRTTHQELMLLPGFWAQPEIAMRLHNEPATGVSANKLARFNAECEVKLVERWEHVSIRWSNRDKWSKPGTAMVAIPQKCTILHEAAN